MSLDFRKNANVLAVIHSFAKPKQPTADDPYVVDGYELHARPDLADRLKSLASHIPDAKLEFAFGIPTLSTVAGRAFAIARGTHSLSLYLPEQEAWGEPDARYGKPWRTGYARAIGRPHTSEDEQHLQMLVRLAYSAATSEDERQH